MHSRLQHPLQAAKSSAIQLSHGGTLSVTLDHIKEAMQCKHLAYDRAGEEHYNLISALHKSMRRSDADASMYWLARMLEAGEQSLNIARRLVRFADPTALNQAVACYQACHFLSMPEYNVCLAQCTAYLALAPKSVAVYRALKEAKRAVKESVGRNEGVPLHLRNAPTKLMDQLGYGKGYLYPPDHADSSAQTYLPPSLLAAGWKNTMNVVIIDEYLLQPVVNTMRIEVVANFVSLFEANDSLSKLTC